MIKMSYVLQIGEKLELIPSVNRALVYVSLVAILCTRAQSKEVSFHTQTQRWSVMG